MDIANPILNLEKQRKCKHKFLYIPGNMDMVDQSQSPLHNSSANGNENTRFPLVCSMETLFASFLLLAQFASTKVILEEHRTTRRDLEPSCHSKGIDLVDVFPYAC
jgi:hypothetical protein